jgi:uncharacterized protein (UPF0303 family)
MADDKELTALLGQEARLQFRSFNSQTALLIGSKIASDAGLRNKAVVIDIQRSSQVLFHYAMTGTTPDNAKWIERKCRVVMRFFHSSLYMGKCYEARGTTFAQHTGLSIHEYAAKGGAFPLLIRDVGVVGTIAVSGLSQEDDHAIIVSALEHQIARNDF